VALLGVGRGELVERTRTDERDDFRELASAQLPRLYSIARRLVGDDAEDAVQDCLLKAFKRYGQLRAVECGPAWLTSILVNSCRDHARADARRPREIDFDEAEKFSLYRKIAYEDPFPYSDSRRLPGCSTYRWEPCWRACIVGASCSRNSSGSTPGRPGC
jgi:RNA polymerase sigma-70 factor (ECF subfamily)